tara:strand:+ start:125 stop:646 length:522 start_codon:yes stop_codon:yes gene_type:complete
MSTDLQFIKSQSVTSAVATSSVTDCFNDNYSIYKVVARNIVTSAEAFLRLQFINSAGSIISSADYGWADLFLKANTTFLDRKDATDNYIYDFNLSKGTISGGAGNTVAYIYNPTNASSYTYITWSGTSVYDSTYGFGQKGVGVLKQASDVTGMHFIMDSSATFTGEILIYGVK